MYRRKTFEEIKTLYENNVREIIGIELREHGRQGKKQTYVNYRCLIDKYEGWMSLNGMKNGQGCLKCSGLEKLTLSEVKEKSKEINPNIEILSNEYVNAQTKLRCRCVIDNYEWEAKWNHLSKGVGCPMCAGRILHDGNRLSLLRPDLIKYFYNSKDADNYTVSSGKRVQLKCPKCEMLKTKLMPVDGLSSRGFSCEYCSDGISIPEKFGIYLFKQLGIEFETQKRFNWAKDKYYDKYFVLNEEEFICEIHGRQHYEEISIWRSLKEEQENDKLKYDLAIQNGIKPENYIAIDCRKSELEWLKENFIKQLNNIFDLSNLDWHEAYLESQNSTVIKIWNFWNNKNEKDTITTLANIFRLDKNTIRRYLKCGDSIGKCTYNAKTKSPNSQNI